MSQFVLKSSIHIAPCHTCEPSNFCESVPVLQWLSDVSSMLWLCANTLCSSPLTSFELSALPWLKRSASVSADPPFEAAGGRKTRDGKSEQGTRKRSEFKENSNSNHTVHPHLWYWVWVPCLRVCGLEPAWTGPPHGAHYAAWST